MKWCRKRDVFHNILRIPNAAVCGSYKFHYLRSMPKMRRSHKGHHDCATTALLSYLGSHPRYLSPPPKTKETSQNQNFTSQATSFPSHHKKPPPPPPPLSSTNTSQHITISKTKHKPATKRRAQTHTKQQPQALLLPSKTRKKHNIFTKKQHSTPHQKHQRKSTSQKK